MAQMRNIENCESGRSVGVRTLIGRPDCVCKGGWVMAVAEGLAEDARGLRVLGRVIPRVSALVAAGRLRGLSFGYRVKRAAGMNPRALLEVELIEVSLVRRPMQPLARVIAVEV